MDKQQHTATHRVDSHHHFWRRDRGDYDWLTPDLTDIYDDFLPEQLRPILQQAKIEKTILVQAAETDAETNYLLAIAEQTDFVSGVVAWVDMESKSVESRLTALTKNPYFKSIRPMIQDMADEHWMLQPSLNKTFSALINMKLSFDALVKPQHLKTLHKLLLRHPELSVVIDHGAKPQIASGQFQDWAQQISLIANDTQALCKISGLITEAGKRENYNALEPYLDHLLNCFGADRLMWGSDWPVVNMASDYSSWLSFCEHYLSRLSPSEQDAIWSKTATRFYRI